MVIKRLSNYKKRIIIKVKTQNNNTNGGVGMVLCLEKYKNQIDNNPTINLSLADMLFDKEKRNTIYKQYDKDYVSTKEEDEIYNEMTNRYYKEKEE